MTDEALYRVTDERLKYMGPHTLGIRGWPNHYSRPPAGIEQGEF